MNTFALSGTSPDDLRTIVSMYYWPSQSLWRLREVEVLKHVNFQRPILEIGCGTSGITALIVGHVEQGIDINPRAVERSKGIVTPSGKLYGSVQCKDAHDLASNGAQLHRTILANCVMEHIDDLDEALRACHDALSPGGQLVLTVPLTEMDNHMTFSGHWYTRMRQRQLNHVNLLSSDGWEAKLAAARLTVLYMKPYLHPKECLLWDRLDIIGCIGSGRYRIATGVSWCLRRMPKLANWVASAVTAYLRRCVRNMPRTGPPCAVLIVAERKS